MATLKIYNDIVGEEEKTFLSLWQESPAAGVCYKDIDEFLASMPAGDNAVDIRLHCRGGDCIEGWAIYDALRQSGKEISCTVEGECSSMATIILLAAPAARRHAYPNAHFCIHNPALGCMPEAMPDSGRLTAAEVERAADKLATVAGELRAQQQRMVDLYAERTGADPARLAALMERDTYISAEEARDLGFISGILPPLTATKTRTIHNITSPKTNNAMKKEFIKVESGKLNRLLAKAGLRRLSRPVALAVTAADGTVLTIDRQEGEPQVGDSAHPDGEFIMDDGTAIIVADGVITAIVPPAEGPVPPPPAPEEGEPAPVAVAEEEAPAEEGEPAEEDVPAPSDGDELLEQIELLIRENEELTRENEELRAQVEAKRGARVLSADERIILACVARAGGRRWLDAVLASRSTFNAPARGFSSAAAKGNQRPETETQRRIRQLKARRAKQQ